MSRYFLAMNNASESYGKKKTCDEVPFAGQGSIKASQICSCQSIPKSHPFVRDTVVHPS